MGLLDRFKAMLGVEAPVVYVDIPNVTARQGDTLRFLVKIEARATSLELLALRARVGVNPQPADDVPGCCDWGDSEEELDRTLQPGEHLEKELVLTLDANTPVPSDDVQVQLVVQVDVRGIAAPTARRTLQILPSVSMQAVIDSLAQGFALGIEEVGASLESKEFGLLYPDCTMVAFEAGKESFVRLGPAARAMEDVFLSNDDGGIKLYLFAPNAAERWEKATEGSAEFIERYQVRYQPDIEELSLVLPESDIFAPDRTVQGKEIIEIVHMALRLMGGGTEKLL